MLKSKSSPIRKFLFLVISLVTLYFVGSFYKEEMDKIVKPNIDAWEVEPTADCALVLTGGPGRIKEGLDLMIRGQVQKLIISGVNPQVSVRDLFPQLVLYPNLQEKDIILEKRSETTYGNAQQSLPLVEAMQCKSILLVTSYLHIYRAMESFKSIFPTEINIIPYSVSGTQIPPTWGEIFVESTKSLFYSLWVYK